MHTITKGDITTLTLAAKFLRLGFIVLRPLSENSRYDLVIDRGVGFERVQCKTGRLRKGRVVFNAYSSHAHRGKPLKLYRGEADLFGVFCPDNDGMYLVPVERVGYKGYLRIEPAKNSQARGIRDAKEFLLP